MRKNMQICLIVAMAENYVIGKDGKLPWHLKDDLIHFKKITSGKSIIMGRATFDSIGRALPNRKNIVITRNNNVHYPNTSICHSLHQALALCKQESEVFIIGGASIYAQAIDIADKIYLTTVHTHIEGDTFFPQFEKTSWVCSSLCTIEKNASNDYACSIELLEK